uniref:Uncharacterized protein n=1 Tax=Caenorhabditis japonica TaxID=281687 RepID=A0A8R1ICN1_CAEJA
MVLRKLVSLAGGGGETDDADDDDDDDDDEDDDGDGKGRKNTFGPGPLWCYAPSSPILNQSILKLVPINAYPEPLFIRKKKEQNRWSIVSKPSVTILVSSEKVAKPNYPSLPLTRVPHTIPLLIPG